MDPISKLTRLLEALRLQQGSARTTRSGRATAAGDAAGSETQSNAAGLLSAKLNLEQLNRRIGERINQLAPEERNGDKAVEQFVDSVLAWEFGEDLADSATLSRYSKKVRAAIKSNSRLSGEFEQFLKSLTRA